MHWLRLDVISGDKAAMRAKAKRALLRFSAAAIDTLRDDDEEFLQGAGRWCGAVQCGAVRGGALRCGAVRCRAGQCGAGRGGAGRGGGAVAVVT